MTLRIQYINIWQQQIISINGKRKKRFAIMHFLSQIHNCTLCTTQSTSHESKLELKIVSTFDALSFILLCVCCNIILKFHFIH